MAKVNHPSPDLIEVRERSQSISILAGNIIVAIMMMSLAVGVVQFGGRLSPGWQGGYLVWLCLIISLESIYTRKRARMLEGKEKVFFRISEWVAIAVAIKILLYLVNDPAQLLADLPNWQKDFIDSFFTTEYILALVLSLGVWLSASAYSGEMEDLYEREKDAEWDELGKLQNALKAIRGRISSRIFAIGTLVVGLAVASRVDASAIFRERGVPPPGYQTPVVNVLIYFILALLMLSLTQFALLRTRWQSQRLPVSPWLASNWLKSGLAFFVVLSIVVFFLPTDYSLGLLETLRYSIDILIKVISFLLLLITLPLTFCLSLFRFSQPGGNDASPPPPSFYPPPAVDPQQPQAWWEVVRSLAFWIIFFGIIIFAIRYYLMQNSVLWNDIKKFPLFRWLTNVFGEIWKWLKGANREINGLVRRGIKRLRPLRAQLPVQTLRRIFNIAHLEPRDKIIFYYLNLTRLGGERGLERRPAQTPYQYENKLQNALPDLESELHQLTDSFIEARYSRHPQSEPNARQAASLWEQIKAILRSWRKPDA